MNQPMPFDAGLVRWTHVNTSAVERRAASLGGRRMFKVEAQVAALLRAALCMDLTTLAGDDTPGRVKRLCAKALNPVRREILAALGVETPITVGAVCVYPALVPAAVKALAGRLPVASVATDFPSGQMPTELKLPEITWAIEQGATEIDVVINRGAALEGRWRDVYDEIVAFRQACGERAKLKTILGVGNLGTLLNVARAAAVAIMAGSDTIKTSTGFEPTNATIPAGLVMVREMRRFMTEFDPNLILGFKPAGGIKDAAGAMRWLALILEELGEAWTHPDRFRIGASALLTDIERQLEHLATGQYAATHHQPMA